MAKYLILLSYTKDNKAIRIQKDDLRDNDIWDVKNTYDSSATSTYLVSEFSKIDKQFTLPTLHKENQQYIRRCGWTYIGNEKYGQQFQDESIRKFEKVIPVGYTIKNVKNNFWSKNKNQQYWYITLIPLMIFVICSIQFESIFRGIQIILIIPMSFIGIFITFYYFDVPFDQGGYVSFLMTSGLAVNSIIFILSSYHHFKSIYPQYNSLDHYYYAVKDKIKSILLTTISTVLGLMPFLMHGDSEVFWFALAAGTIGGLTFSILVLVVVFPAIIIQDLKAV